MVRIRQRLGKYRIQRRLARGGFADVYAAFDTIEGLPVALKIPRNQGRDSQSNLRKEVRLSASLDHPCILAIKNADHIEGRLVIAYPRAEANLDERLKSRLSTKTKLDYTEEMLAALAHAHELRIIHCDIKPENFLVFDDGSLKLTDFGIARLSAQTRIASLDGSGTLGYMAPEQALGKPSFRSDVFSLGLVLYRMYTGVLPEWPYEWPLPRAEQLRRTMGAKFVAFLRRALEVNERRRYRDAVAMETQFRELLPHLRRRLHGQRKRRPGARQKTDWKQIRFKEFQRRHGKTLQTNLQCKRCEGPVAETMLCCPWCGADRKIQRDETVMHASCRRCHRGMKLDWRYCPWCYGAGYEPATKRELTDRRYSARCSNASCERKLLWPFMRYCPWCQRKVRQKWKIEGAPAQRCRSCSWGTVSDFWEVCPWCTKRLAKGSAP